MNENQKDIHMPSAGIDLQMAFGKQPNKPVGEGVYARTTPQAVNVRGDDAVTGRARGGSRSGLSRYIDARVSNEAYAIVEIYGDDDQFFTYQYLIQDLAVVVVASETAVPEPDISGGGGPSGPVEITTASPLTAGSGGSPYSVQLAATGGVGRLDWTVVSGSLPAGIVMDSNGLIAGTP